MEWLSSRFITVVFSSLLLSACSGLGPQVERPDIDLDHFLTLCGQDTQCRLDVTAQLDRCVDAGNFQKVIDAARKERDYEKEKYRERLTECFRDSAGLPYFTYNENFKYLYDADMVDQVTEQFARFSRWVVQGRFDQAVTKWYPPAVEEMGGHDAVVDYIRRSFREIKLSDIKDVQIEAPDKVLTEDGELFAVLRYGVLVDTGRRRGFVKSYYIGWSGDQGKSWYFFDGSRISDTKIHNVFANYRGGLILPPQMVVQRR